MSEVEKLRVVHERLKDLNHKFMWQVRDTCARAEKAEARLRENEGEVLRAVMAMHAIRDGEYGDVPQSVRDFINTTLDAHPDDLPKVDKEAEKLRVEVVMLGVCNRGLVRLNESTAVRAEKAEAELARFRETPDYIVGFNDGRDGARDEFTALLLDVESETPPIEEEREGHGCHVYMLWKTVDALQEFAASQEPAQ